MRLYVLIFGVIVTGICTAQAPTDDSSKATQNNSETTAEPVLLAHSKAPKAESNQIKVIIKKDQIIEEYRHKGELIMVKVIPTEGVPYYIDPQARNKRTGAHSDLINSGVEPVHWVIKRF